MEQPQSKLCYCPNYFSRKKNCPQIHIATPSSKTYALFGNIYSPPMFKVFSPNLGN